MSRGASKDRRSDFGKTDRADNQNDEGAALVVQKRGEGQEEHHEKVNHDDFKKNDNPEVAPNDSQAPQKEM